MESGENPERARRRKVQINRLLIQAALKKRHWIFREGEVYVSSRNTCRLVCIHIVCEHRTER